MSTELFSKLSLDDAMVTTRAAAARAARTNSSSSDDAPPSQPGPVAVEPTPPPLSPIPSLVISTNKLQYNVSNFDYELRRRAEKGLQENDIRVKYCAASDDDESPVETKYIYIEDDITVAMGGKLQRPKCNCGANEGGVACKHIFWVNDQIVSKVPDILDNQPLALSPDGSIVHDIKLAEILNVQDIASVAKELSWIHPHEDLPDSIDEVRHNVLTMLSTFEPQGALPGEFTNTGIPLPYEQSKRYQDFAELITRYVARNPGMYIEIRKVIDSNFQSQVFFAKVDRRIAEIFGALDEWITRDPSTASVDTVRIDVPNCATRLTELVKAIDDFYHEQPDDDPATRDVAIKATAALVTILDRVTDRNENAYENITWDFEASEEPSKNNLFVALIGYPNSTFVLDALHSLPQEDLHRNHWETLQGIERKLHNPHTPLEYMLAFHKMVAERRKRAASDIREGDLKRAMQSASEE